MPEEKRRGITIELGFAELLLGDFRLGIVDVPGHERFVRNMLAGATGMDLAMLVVAADDSVKPQTREHLEILRLLDLPAGVIVLTKCDLADPEWIDLVEEEVREMTAGTFLADPPMVRTSVMTGLGLDALREALAAAAERAARSQRMAMRGTVSDGHRPLLHHRRPRHGRHRECRQRQRAGGRRIGYRAGRGDTSACAACRTTIGRWRRSTGASVRRSIWPASITKRSAAVKSWRRPATWFPAG